MRREVVVFVIAALAVLAGPGAAAQPTHRGRPVPAVPLHVALGDSVAAGVGASAPESTGYVPLVTAEARGLLDCSRSRRLACRRLRLQNLAVPGATTSTLIQNQLPLAIAELEARNGNRLPIDDVELITLDIGGNDAFALVSVCADGPTPECLTAAQRRLQAVAANLDQIIGALRAAAGSDTEIVVMTYYNPLPGCVLSHLAPIAEVVLEGGAGLPAGLNDLIRATAAAYGATVAETHGRLDPIADTVGGSDCLHPDDSGHAAIAAAFAAALAQPPIE